ncbi:MAG: LLM class flavin-dependent oxidoreductase [Deltaproteobacteria bacterium]|nr:LLM class flavin-dependent oxidoreductase [Deltaproteobacteria bacterium]
MRVEARFSCYLIGSESLLVQCAEILRERGHEIRGIASEEAPILAWARERGIATIDPSGDLATELAGDFDYLFSITHLALLPDSVLRRPRRAAINFHDGPLPSYAGMYTPAWALIAREPRYGISWHVMRSELDEGDLLATRSFDVAPNETSLTINTKCYEAAIESFGPLCDALAAGTASPIPQDLSQKRYFGKWLRPAAAGLLDFTRPAQDLEALVRALDFGRYENPLATAKLQHRGRVWNVGRAQAETASAAAEPGTVIAIEADALVVAAGGGSLRLGDFSEPRGRRVTVSELASSLGITAGARLEGASSELAERLGALNAELCKGEEFFVRRLGSLEPLEPPYLRAERAASGASDWRELELEIPAEFASRPGSGADSLVAGFATWLARLCDRTRFDLAFRDEALRSRIAGLEAFAADVVPLRIALDESASADAALAKARDAIASTRKRVTFLHDAIARHPSLRGNAELESERLLPVLAEIGGATGAISPPPGTLLAFVAAPDGSRARLGYDARALDESSALSMRAQLAVFLREPSRPFVRLALLSPEQRRQVLETWNATDAPYPRDTCVHQLFEQQVRRTPDRPAASFETETLSYRELDARANRLAAHLRELGIGPDKLVGIFIERSIDMLVGVLAVQKAGGAYVPLDPAYPRDRIAFMLEDSGATVVLTQERIASELPASTARVVRIDSDWPAIARHADTPVASGVAPANLAYVIYTSGSTGRPKGVMVEHRNVVNFFAGMDALIPHDPPGVWLAVTSLSFDISVLELLWTLARGFEVVIHAERGHAAGDALTAPASGPQRKLEFGFFLWGSDDAQGSDKYRLMLESARFADRNGFLFVSTPERHFHAFGGPYPNPAVTSAAIAAVTERVQIRAGSCVLPLHHPIRVAEDWAVVDNLSNGRVAIGFAAGWQPNDFVIRPDGYADAKGQMFRLIDTVKRLWRGETVEFPNPLGQLVPVRTLPRPVQPELPSWVTVAGNPETFRMAGEAGENVLTHLLGQSVDEVAEKVKIYREARARAGHDPKAGVVTLMLHTFVGASDDEVREIVREPMKQYLSSAVNLVKSFAWAFPAFKRPGGANATPDDVDLESLSAEELDAILEHAFERYFETSGLFGTPDTCAKMIERVRAADVDEIGCLIDYGVPTARVLQSLDALDVVRRRANPTPVAREQGPADFSLAAQLERRNVTHMQCTPSMAKMIAMNDEMRAGLARVQQLYIGGEAFPASLARELSSFVRANVTNMYGPTETTIWSTTQPVRGALASIPIGRPIANTRIYVLDRHLEPVPVGVAGELYIGGDGVVRGYHRRAELSAERFLPDPWSGKPGARMYRTGDLARYRDDGTIEFMGRIDHQVKIRGYRIELGEVETELGRHPAIQECVVVARDEADSDPRLVAYLVPKGTAPATEELREHLRKTLPEFMVPALFVSLAALPLTPNGKIDRKRLPAPEQHKPRMQAPFVAPQNPLEGMIAGVWRDVLKLETVGAEDNFFDLGGHSLLVVQVHRKLREQVPQPLSLTDLYRFPTIRSLAEFLGSDGSNPQLDKSVDRAAARRESLKLRQQTRRRPGSGDA